MCADLPAVSPSEWFVCSEHEMHISTKTLEDASKLNSNVPAHGHNRQITLLMGVDRKNGMSLAQCSTCVGANTSMPGTGNLCCPAKRVKSCIAKPIKSSAKVCRAELQVLLLIAIQDTPRSDDEHTLVWQVVQCQCLVTCDAVLRALNG